MVIYICQNLPIHYIWVVIKNRKNVSRARAKTNASGTTSLSNNAIQNAR